MNLKETHRIRQITYEGRITMRELLDRAEVSGTQFESVRVTFAPHHVEMVGSKAPDLCFTLIITENIGA